MPEDMQGDPQLRDALADVAPRFARTIERTEPVGSAPHLLRVVTGDGDVAIRASEPRATMESVSLTARALLLARPSGEGRLPVPQPVLGDASVWGVRIGERIASAASWLPGRPLARYGDFRTPDGEVIDVPLPASAPAEAIVLDAVRTVGRFHTATSSLVHDSQVATAPLSRILRNSEAAWSTQRREVGQRAAGSPEIRRWLRCGNRILPVATELLEHAGSAGTVACLIHGDLWPANLLIDGNGPDRTLTGVVGWSGVTAGSPLIDLAHLAIHTSGWSGAAAETILGAYTEVAPLAPVERRMLPVVAALDLVPRVGWLLNLAFVDDRMIGHESQPVLRSGLKSLLTSLENLTQILAPEPEWNQRKAGEQRQARLDAVRKKPSGTRTTPARQPGSGRSRPGSRPGRPKTG
jgi:Ser/Thr protein kinase RdoA (MazF antagonist)